MSNRACYPTRLIADTVPEAIWPELKSLLSEALVAVELAGEFGEVCLCIDGFGGKHGTWYYVLPPAERGAGQRLVLTCHWENFCRHHPFVSGDDGPLAVWEHTPVPDAAPAADCAPFSAERSQRFLHHHLLTVADMRHGQVRGRELPIAAVEGFADVWAVTVDGRLMRQELPGFPLAERRRQFADVFGAVGVLLPHHWQTFEALWSGGISGQAAVLGAVASLPRL